MSNKLLRTNLLLVLFVWSSINAPAAAAVTISLNSSSTYQTITGWEANAQSGQVMCAGFDLYKNYLFDQAVYDLGINRLRLEIKSGLENPVDWFNKYMNGQISYTDWRSHWGVAINDNGDPKIIDPGGFQFSELDNTVEKVILPIRTRLNTLGKTLFLNVNYVDFQTSDFEHKNNPLEYAEFVLATYQHLQSKYGLVPDAWEVILEPDSGAAWSASQIAAVIKAAGDLLKSKGYTPHFIAPSTTDMGQAATFFQTIANTAGALKYISELSYHRYKGVSLANLQAIANLSITYGVNTSMLEHIGSSYEDLHDDLKIGRNSAWQQYTLAYCNTNDNGGKYYEIDNQDPNNPVIHTGWRTVYLRQYFKYILPGARRISASTTYDSIDPLAFINPGGNYVVVIKAANSATISLKGLPPGVYAATFTTNGGTQTNPPITIRTSGQLFQTTMPAAGVISIYRWTDQSGGTQQKIYLPFIRK